MSNNLDIYKMFARHNKEIKRFVYYQGNNIATRNTHTHAHTLS